MIRIKKLLEENVKLALKSAESTAEIALKQSGCDIDIYANDVPICFISGESGKVLFFTQDDESLTKLKKMGFVIKNRQIAHA